MVENERPNLKLSNAELKLFSLLASGVNINKTMSEIGMNSYDVAYLMMKINMELERRETEEEKIKKLEKLAERIWAEEAKENRRK